MSTAPQKSFLEKIQSIPARALYACLIVCSSIPLFFTVPLPASPSKATAGFYKFIQEIPDGSTILLESDWTNSSRGESMGSFEALMRMLITKRVKFILYGVDVQSPTVAVQVINRVNEERRKKGLSVHKQWEDYIKVGYMPDIASFANALNTDVLAALKGRRARDEKNNLRDVFESPVMQNVKGPSDIKGLIIVTASSSSDENVKRIKVFPMAVMVTGVMGPEQQVYFDSGQYKGLIIGLRGTVELEKLMTEGLNLSGGVPSGGYKEGHDGVPKVKEGTTADRATKYYFPLHLAMFLLIVGVVVGNLNIIFKKRVKQS